MKSRRSVNEYDKCVLKIHRNGKGTSMVHLLYLNCLVRSVLVFLVLVVLIGLLVLLIGLLVLLIGVLLLLIGLLVLLIVLLLVLCVSVLIGVLVLRMIC